jgi:hypothetical protein
LATRLVVSKRHYHPSCRCSPITRTRFT